ncbi:MAG: hypothetical protein OXB88_00220 [Bacteriovoracales bacterium]|nr:hypothetical protein [Bacteriovoracales bacterium]
MRRSFFLLLALGWVFPASIALSEDLLPNTIIDWAPWEKGRRESVPNQITDPASTIRCQLLKEERDQKLKNKLRAKALLRRSLRVEDSAPERKVSIKRAAEINTKTLKKILTHMKAQDKKMQEKIVLENCPELIL